MQKVGTAKDAAGYWIAYAKDAGLPGAYSLQSPGLNGFATDCSIASQTTDPNGASQMGANLLADPASGSLYLTRGDVTSSAAELEQLIDLMWYNTGIAVTTTTGQTITQGTLAGRDINGTTNGEGVFAALLTTAALGNAGTITNTTITYTNSDGTGSRTGTFSALVGWQAPASPVIGTWMPFQLQAGDRGIRTIQSITLGTSYVSGSMSLVMYRPLLSIPNPLGTTGANQTTQLVSPGVKIWPNSCIWTISVGPSASATLAGTYTTVER
jgi:hypothetical protein